MKDLNVEELNNLIKFGKKIAKIAYVLIAIVGAYAIIRLIKELGVLKLIFSLIHILAPLFIGLVLAWLFDPIVTKLTKNKIKRFYGAIIVYLVFIGLIVTMISLILPAVSGQVDEFASSLPGVYSSVESWVDSSLNNLENIDGFNKEAVREELFSNIDTWVTTLPKTLPGITISIVKSFFEGLGVFVVGLVIGFYLLVSFDSTSDAFTTLIPKKTRQEFGVLMLELNKSLRSFVQGTLLLSFAIFLVSYIAFSIVGLKVALLLAIFCGITNIIPIVGPYIGGIPAVIIGFSQSFTVGILVLIIIFVLQFFEGNFLHPILLSKTMKLHPVTIILGLLIFGYYWGILGMILAAPIISVVKTVFRFLDTKYAILKFNG